MLDALTTTTDALGGDRYCNSGLRNGRMLMKFNRPRPAPERWAIYAAAYATGFGLGVAGAVVWLLMN